MGNIEWDVVKPKLKKAGYTEEQIEDIYNIVESEHGYCGD